MICSSALFLMILVLDILGLFRECSKHFVRNQQKSHYFELLKILYFVSVLKNAPSNGGSSDPFAFPPISYEYSSLSASDRSALVLHGSIASMVISHELN